MVWKLTRKREIVKRSSAWKKVWKSYEKRVKKMSCKSVLFYWSFWKQFRDICFHTFFTQVFTQVLAQGFIPHLEQFFAYTLWTIFTHTFLTLFFTHIFWAFSSRMHFGHFFHACILNIFFTHCIRPSTLSSIHPLGKVERRESGGRGWILCEKRRLHSLPPLRRGPSRAQLGTLWESRTSRCHCDQWLELNHFVRLEKERNEKKQHFPNTFFHALFTLLRCQPDKDSAANQDTQACAVHAHRRLWCPTADGATEPSNDWKAK